MSPVSSPIAATRAFTLALVASAIIYFLLAMAVSWTRTPLDDDAFYASAPYNLYAHGFTGTTIYEPTILPAPGMAKRTYAYPPLYIVLQAAWFKLVGSGIFQMRVHSTLWGFLFLGGWYVVVRRLALSQAAAALTVALLALDYTVAMTATLGRMSMMSAALELSAVAVYVSWRDVDFRRALLFSNSLAMLAGLTHPLAGVLAVTNLAALVIWRDLGRLRWSSAAYVAAPYIVGAAGWAAYIAQDPNEFITQFTVSSVQGKRLGGLAHPFASFVADVRDRYLAYYGVTPTKVDARILLLAVYLAGPVLALLVSSIRHRPECRLLAGLSVLNFVTMMLVDGTRQRVYMVYTMPFLVMWLAIACCTLWPRGGISRMIAAAAIAAFVSLNLAAIGYRVMLNPYAREYMPVVEYVRPIAQRGAFFIAPSPLFFELGFDANMIADPDLGSVTGKKPAAIVLDDEMRYWIATRAEVDPAAGERTRAVLDRYHVAFTAGQYQVYVPNHAR